MSEHTELTTDFLVIGSGIAGLMLALKLAEQGQVVLLAKDQIGLSSSSAAQGGIASPIGPGDSIEHHVQDTLKAGAGLCHEDVVRLVISQAAAAINELIRLGVHFTRENNNAYHLTQEGGHSHRRVLHHKDITGWELVRALTKQVKNHPNIEIREQQLAVDLIVTDKIQPQFDHGNICLGAYVMNVKGPQQEVYTIRSKLTYLCTGGHGRVYLYTSNPDVATGDGLAMGWRAGCKVANLEFMQFHPTCLFTPHTRHFLISEALRGEGAILKNKNEEDFVRKYHPLGSLAPRDIVARAIDQELKESGEQHVFLDARPLGAAKIKKMFPTIYERCRQYGIDMTKQMIPVVPAAHYSCGGLVVNSRGQTNVANLYAVGEVACTGLHGANRLASNSLLEAAVFALIAASHAEKDLQQNAQNPLLTSISIPPWKHALEEARDEHIMVNHAWDEIRRLMWNYVGIVRSDQRLSWAQRRMVALLSDIESFYWRYRLTPDLIEARNLAHVALLTIRCAMARKESRGIHYNIDYPQPHEHQIKDTVLIGI